MHDRFDLASPRYRAHNHAARAQRQMPRFRIRHDRSRRCRPVHPWGRQFQEFFCGAEVMIAAAPGKSLPAIEHSIAPAKHVFFVSSRFIHLEDVDEIAGHNQRIVGWRLGVKPVPAESLIVTRKASMRKRILLRSILIAPLAV